MNAKGIVLKNIHVSFVFHSQKLETGRGGCFSVTTLCRPLAKKQTFEGTHHGNADGTRTIFTLSPPSALLAGVLPRLIWLCITFWNGKKVGKSIAVYRIRHFFILNAHPTPIYRHKSTENLNEALRYYFTFWEFFPSASTDDLLLESEW